VPDSEGESAHAGRLKVPFGPFLAVGAMEFFFFGDRLVSAYFAALGG
jgi:prepilin signal peptidase PulO-like enzyme (type II secretory pathway)